MKLAVPSSAFVAVIATGLRFAMNFKTMHPYDEKNRVALDYEVVKLVMPAVFLGSMIGVKLGNMIGSNWQVLIFGTTVTWSIYTSYYKAKEVYLKEKAEEEKKNNGSQPDNEADKPLINDEDKKEDD